ncbi:MAG TPA: septal ring lytic transglycosylase RlpA family protein, partial [Burkholderiaceae bacterium]|nr:septal ring lytic transglycosylase RlpA family protein [Burkholderiaceae bacterium]
MTAATQARARRRQVAWRASLSCLALAIAGCASGPSSRPGGYYENDGPPARAPANPQGVPDAEPRVEPFAGGPNRPYVVKGRRYTPLVGDVPFRQRGYASWYGRQFHGRKTSNGETFDMYAMTAAHPTLPIPSYARVRHLESGREVIVRINDRGPFHANRIIDLSYMAALKLGFVHRGSAMVEVERLTHDEIRAGTWRRGGGETVVAREGAGAPAGGAPVAPAGAAPPAPAEPPAPVATVSATGAEAQPVHGGAASPTFPPGFWVQLGAFRQREGAHGFQRQVSSELAW